MFILDSAFCKQIDTALSTIPTGRRAVLRIAVHSMAEPVLFDAAELLRDYSVFLGGALTDLDRFIELSNEQVPWVCSQLAGYDLVVSTPHIPKELAVQLASMWRREFSDDAQFFANGKHVLGTPEELCSGDVLSLFHADLEAGVLAVSRRKLGIFWNASSS